MRTETRKAGRRLGLRADARGTVAIEFAMIVPVLLALYMGTVDLSLGFTVFRKLSHATSVMNDLVSRTNNVTRSDLDAIFGLGDAIIAPRADKLDSAKISAIYVDAAGQAKIRWSRGRDTTADPVGTTVSLPSDLAGYRDTNLVRTVATYTYRAMGSYGRTGTFVRTTEVYSVPRTGTGGVTCSDCPT